MSTRDSGAAAAPAGECTLLSLGPDRIIEVGHAQLQKDGEQAAGDTVRLRRVPAEERAMVVLSDGLGSGVKASVLSSLTATMALEYVTSDIEPARVAGIVMRTLPVCSVRKIRYATFTALNIRASGGCDVVNYDNPGPFLADAEACRTIELDATEIPGASGRRTTAYTGSVEVGLGQYVVSISDGVTQAGMGSRRYPLGWGSDGLQAFLLQCLKAEPEMSGQELARRVVNAAARIDGDRPKDDISCAVLYLRRPRRLLIATGPPIDADRDGEIAEAFDGFPGKRIVAGGTTANLIARELGRSVTVNLRERDPDIPPTSNMEGADLVTEGTMTMSRVAELLESDEPRGFDRINGATRIVDALLDSDEIHFLVGTKINEAHQNPSVPMELEIRRNLMKRICRSLEERYLKRTQIRFI
jgi:hypothetical protein